MPRKARVDLGGYVYHVLNRANGRRRIFDSDSDYLDFEYLLNEMRETFDMRILAFVIMPNHWHLMLYPKTDGDVARALKWLSSTHAVRHHTRHKTVGEGHVYQGRYKSFLIQDDTHLLNVLKYIERNPVRTKLCSRAEDWRWGSACRRLGALMKPQLLSDVPVELPSDYREWINETELPEILSAVRDSVSNGTTYGEVLIPKLQH